LKLDDLDDSQRMRRIMAQLTPPDRDYLRERLAAQRLGLSDDGEMVSLDEVLSEYEDTSRQADSD
jgi:phage FluMu protein gp41